MTTLNEENNQSAFTDVPNPKSIAVQTESIIDLDNSNLSEKCVNLESLADCLVYDEFGNRFRLSEIWSDYKTIIIFVRSFLCFTSKEYVEDLSCIPREEFIKNQIRLVVIGCAHWKHIKQFRQLTKFPYLIFCDIDYEIYNRLEFERNNDFGQINQSRHVKSTNLGGLFSSAIRAMFNSPLFDYQGKFDQQGGSMIVGPGPILHFFHKDKNARDHSPINELLARVGIRPVNFDSKNEKVFNL